jgi:hypothetical protein
LESVVLVTPQLQQLQLQLLPLGQE